MRLRIFVALNVALRWLRRFRRATACYPAQGPTDSAGVYERAGKRCLDFVLALSTLVLVAWLLVLIGLAIWIEDRGPVLFRQRRIGRKEQDFILLKFRSMPVDVPERPSEAASTIPVTRIGALLRRSNLDELPQLINILRGDMSIVGPRPPLPNQTKLIRLRRFNGACDVRPGLTGLAQIESYDGMPEDKKAAWDAKYCKKISLGMDLFIIMRTFVYLLHRPPVY